MKKKVLAMTLAVMTFAMAGCGNVAEDANADNAASVVSSGETAAEGASDESAAVESASVEATIAEE